MRFWWGFRWIRTWILFWRWWNKWKSDNNRVKCYSNISLCVVFLLLINIKPITIWLPDTWQRTSVFLSSISRLSHPGRFLTLYHPSAMLYLKKCFWMKAYQFYSCTTSPWGKPQAFTGRENIGLVTGTSFCA